LKIANYHHELESLLINNFLPIGYRITKNIEVDSIPENSQYEALFFALNQKNIIYRKGKVTPDRPGAFLSLWKRPLSSSINNKPIPFHSNDLDYLFIKVDEYSNTTINNKRSGIFILPVSLLSNKKIVSSDKNKGKTGFRIFPPWSQDRGNEKTQIFSESAKKTQRWQLPYFLEFNNDGSINSNDLKKRLNFKPSLA